MLVEETAHSKTPRQEKSWLFEEPKQKTCVVFGATRGAEEERVAKDAVMGEAQARLVCPQDFIRGFGLHSGYRVLRSEKPINRMKLKKKKIRKDRVLTLTTSG